jgi:hypothetical protein
VDAFVPGAGGADEGIGPYFIDFAIHNLEQTLDIRIRPGVVPRGTRILAFFPPFKTRGTRIPAATSRETHTARTCLQSSGCTDGASAGADATQFLNASSK